MPSQKDTETSASAESVKPATPTTPTPAVAPAATATTSKPSVSINPATGAQFKDDCIVLVLGPKGTVHPMIDPKNPAGIRVFENANEALGQIESSKVASTRPFAIIALKGIF
jgi:hypothetical protein